MGNRVINVGTLIHLEVYRGMVLLIISNISSRPFEGWNSWSYFMESMYQFSRLFRNLREILIWPEDFRLISNRNIGGHYSCHLRFLRSESCLRSELNFGSEIKRKIIPYRRNGSFFFNWGK